MTQQIALKYDLEVRADGRVEFKVPFAPGSQVVVFVIETVDDLSSDLLTASQSSLGFWDNPFDDKDWNDA